MAEGPKVRLVRCPKCDNLLPERLNYSVYECGGCGAILRAKERAQASDVLSENSVEEKRGGGFEKLESLMEKKGGNVKFSSETEMEDDGSGTECGSRRKERMSVDRKANFINSLPKKEKKEAVVAEFIGVGEQLKDFRFERSVEDNEEKEYGYVNKHSRLSEYRMNHWSHGTNQYMNMNRSESVSSSMGDTSTQLNKFLGSMRSRPGMDQSGVERGRFEGLYGNKDSVVEQGRTPAFALPDEGLSNYKPYSLNGHEKQMNSNGHVNVPNEVENLEKERAKLLRELDELREQLSRSCYVADKPSEREPVYRAMPYPYGHQVTYNGSMQPPAMDKQIPRPPYFNYSHKPVSLMNHHINVQNFYPAQKHVLNKIPEYEDPFQPQMHRNPHQYPQISPHEYYSGQYRNFELDPIATYPHETFSHASTCSRLSCYNQNWQVPPRVPPTKAPVSSNFYHHEDPVIGGQQSYPPSQFLDSQPQTRWRSDLDSENDAYSHPRRMVANHGIGRLCHPIAGGAPFIICHKCFEVLKLPIKLRMMNNNQQRLRCGSCSTLIFLKVEHKKLIVSYDPRGLKLWLLRLTKVRERC